MKKLKLFLFFILLGSNVQHTCAQTVTAFAGICDTFGYTGDFLPATNAKLSGPKSILSDAAGNVYFCELFNRVVRKVNSVGIITTFAGNGTIGYSGDNGPATNAQLAPMSSVALDKAGNIYIGDGVNNRVRKVDAAGIITTFAGNGLATPSGDGGPATAAGLGGVGGICFDTAGNLYIYAEKFIRKVNTAGIISKYAGTGAPGYSGDGGMADTAKLALGSIDYLKTDVAGNMYYYAQGRVRKISATGIINTIAGSTVLGYSGDFGPATAAKFGGSGGVFPDSCGNLYIADYANNVVRIISAAGIVYTMAGTGVVGCSGNGGEATAAQFDNPTYVYLDKHNDLYISDHENHVVRKIHFPRCDSLVFPTSAVGDVEAAAEGMHIFPNPTDGDFSVRINTAGNAPLHVAVVTMVGAVAREYTIMPGKETPISTHLPAGIYLVVAETVKGRLVNKVVVR